MRVLKDLVNLFYPKVCLSCEKHLLGDEKLLCIDCSLDMPLIDNVDYKKNEISAVFEGKVPVVNTGAFLYFRNPGKTKDLIHNLKYKNNQEVGTYLGRWFGEEVKTSGCFKGVDCIVPVPLHPKKLKSRGYNQLTTFGKTLSEILEIPYLENVLVRKLKTETQTYKSRLERFEAYKKVFDIVKTDDFEGKHFLLIDDVITTGATLEACIHKLSKVKNAKVSVLAMAYTK